MNKLPFIKKFVLVSVCFSLPLILLGAALLNEINKDIAISQEELIGIHLLEQTFPLLNLAHEYRDTRMIQRANLDKDIADRIAKIQTEITASMSTLKQVAESQNHPILLVEVNRLNDYWLAMTSSSAGAAGGPNIQFQYYDTMVNHIELFIKTIVYEYKLIHDPDLDTLFLINLVTSTLPATMDNLGYSRGYGSYALSLNAISYETFKTFDRIYDDFQANHELLKQNTQFALNENTSSKLEAIVSSILKVSSDASSYFYTELIEKDYISEKWDTYYSTLSTSFSNLNNSNSEILPIIANQISRRIRDENLKLIGIGIGMVIMILVIFYLYSGMYISIALVSVNFIRQAKKVADGDLSVHLDVRSNDELSQLYVAFNDMIKQLKENQETILQAEKMASLGGMIAGVAHEMNTPLGVSATAVSKLKEDLDLVGKRYDKGEIKRSHLETYLNCGQEGLSLIEKNIQRCSKLINSFKQLSIAPKNESQETIDIIPIIKNVISPTGILNISQTIDIQLEADEEVHVNVDPDLLSLVLVNIISNILQHAFPEGDGKIRVKAEKSDGRLFLDIEDNGIGISDEDLEQIFEPFYTTRRNQGYVGLGLHIVYVILTQALHGSIKVESSPNNGAHFKIEMQEFNPYYVQKNASEP